MKKIGNKVRVWVFMMWRPILAFMAVTVVVVSIFGFQLGSLTHGASPSEVKYVSVITSARQFLKSPQYIVHKVPVYVLFKLHVSSLSAYRAVSASFACLAVVSCFFILREWYSDRVAALGAWLLLTSAYMLHIGRLATPEATYLLMLPMLWAVVWLYQTTLRKSALLLLSFLAGLCFYVPGFGWLIILGVAWRYKFLWKELRLIPRWYRVVCAFVFIVVLLPLLWSAGHSLGVFLTILGLPIRLVSVRQIVMNLINIPGNIFLRGPDDPTKWLGCLPILDAFSGFMLIVGAYSLRHHIKLIRFQLLAGSALILVIMIALGGPVTIIALVPLMYILIAAGIAFMLQQWFTVFPNNPVARTLATTLLSTVVLLMSFYHINHYFIAWPQTPATKTAFTKTLIK